MYYLNNILLYIYTSLTIVTITYYYNNIDYTNNFNSPSTLARVYLSMGRAHSIQSNGCEKTRKSGHSAPLSENLIANRGIMYPWCRREAVDPRPSPGLNAMMPGTTLTPFAATTTPILQ